jgi:hypothetical protein
MLSMQIQPGRVVEEGVTTLSWSGGQATIMLAQPVNPARHMCRILHMGDDLTPASFIYWVLQVDRIVIYSPSGAAGYVKTVAWQVRRVPSGRVERGISPMTIGAAGTTVDIALANPINAKTELNLCAAGRFIALYPTGGYITGYLRKHPTDPHKLQCVSTGYSYSTGGTGNISWEAWTP